MFKWLQKPPPKTANHEVPHATGSKAPHQGELPQSGQEEDVSPPPRSKKAATKATKPKASGKKRPKPTSDSEDEPSDDGEDDDDSSASFSVDDMSSTASVDSNPLERNGEEGSA